MKRVTLFVALLTVAACSVLGSQVDRAAASAARSVSAYCANFTPDQRQAFGDKVRTRAAPASIRVTCTPETRVEGG